MRADKYSPSTAAYGAKGNFIFIRFLTHSGMLLCPEIYHIKSGLTDITRELYFLSFGTVSVKLAHRFSAKQSKELGLQKTRG